MRLSRLQAQTLVDYAVQAAPHEVCGLLAGSADEVQAIVPIANIASDPEHYFEMDRAAFVQAMFQFQKQGLNLIGIYHSHPAGEPIPSPADVAQALYPDVTYVIVGLASSHPQLAAWSIHKYEVNPVDLVMGQLPQPADHLELSTTGRAAIILSAIIAVILALVISLSLLPPAPVIP